jgi:hypothetical protein
MARWVLAPLSEVPARSTDFRQMPAGFEMCGVPLSSDARIREALKKVPKRLPIIRERRTLVGHDRIKNRHELGQFGMGESGMLMMNPMERLVKQTESHELAEPSMSHDASCGTVDGRTRESDVFDIFSQALHVSGQPGWRQIQPKQIFPQTPPGDRCEDGRPQDEGQRKLKPDAPAEVFSADARSVPEERTQKKKWSMDESETKLENDRENSGSTRDSWKDEGPKLFVTLGGQVRMVRLMDDTVEAKACEAKGSNQGSVDFIEEPFLAQKAMGGLVQSDQSPVHEVARKKHQRDRQPVKAVVHSDAEGDLGNIENAHYHRESGLAHPMRLVRFNRGIRCRGSGIH